MYCTSCGVPRDDKATVCANCGERIRRFPPRPQINNYLIPAVLTAFCCCMPIGVVGIIYAAQVNSKLMAGDITGAQAAAKNAKMWSWIAFGAGALISFAYGAFIAYTIATSK
jgi:ABC-type enterobactin transport system permease subunit